MGHLIDGVITTPLKIISVVGGDVLHAIKSSDTSYLGFGESYFSFIDPLAIKGWKCHKKMTLNLVVPVGKVKFVLFDDRPDSPTKGEFNQFNICLDSYFRLTVPPLVWVAFQGLNATPSVIMNVANIEHASTESVNKDITEITYEWSRCV